MSQTTTLLDDKARQELAQKFDQSLQSEVLIELVQNDKNPDFTQFSRQFLQELAALNSKIKIKIMIPEEFSDPVLQITNTPDIFLGRDQGYKIEYLGAPAGYEAQSFIETIIRLSCRESGFSPEQQILLDYLSSPLLLESFVTTSCPHCPRSSILNNRIAIANSRFIHARTVESHENSEISREFDIQSVPQQIVNRNLSSKTIGVQPETQYLMQLLQLGCNDYETKIKEWKEKFSVGIPDQPATVLHLNSETMKLVLDKYPLIVVDFWAEWCQPCRMLSPVLEELAPEYQGKIVIAKVNIDEEPELAKQYQVESVPNVLIFKQGNPIEQFVGFRSKNELKKLIEVHLKP